MSGIVVVGAGQAGATLVENLRKGGYTGPLTLVGAEPHPPYQRPPLSKKYLLGEMALERLFLRPLSFYEDQDITLRLNTRVEGIDRDAQQLHLADGGTLPYDKLALTLGSRPRHLPARIGGDLDGVYTVRDLADIDRMSPEFTEGAHVLIVGGGYIGLEAAAVAAAKGLKVTLIEMADRILARVAAPETADFFRELHSSHGVEIREGIGLEHLTGEGRVTQAKLTDGSTLDVDFVIAGIGIEPETWLAEAAGLAIGNGITVDAHGRTSDPAIYAAGDCTCFPHGDGRLRLESVPNAIDQAEAVAQAMLGKPSGYTAKPWFWSDQYDVTLQIAGLNQGYDRIVTRPGSRPGGQSIWYFKGDRLLAVDAMNEPRAYMLGRRWIEAGVSPDPAAIADPASDLKKMATA
ncbi:NAD(P)/FAD-dependent oxidoreductase [Halovulum sp. GXIMD14794]